MSRGGKPEHLGGGLGDLAKEVCAMCEGGVCNVQGYVKPELHKLEKKFYCPTSQLVE